MSFHKLKGQLKNKYIDFGKNLLVWTLNPINSFARHLIILQGKNPDVIPPFKTIADTPALKAAVSDVRPSFRFGDTKGWTKSHFTNPEKYHPILLGRIILDENKVLKIAKDSAVTTANIEAALQVSIGSPIEVQPKDNLNKKKVVKVRRLKKGVFRRVED